METQWKHIENVWKHIGKHIVKRIGHASRKASGESGTYRETCRGTV